MRESVVMLILCEPDPARVWGGVGDLTIPANTAEGTSETYLGAGELLDVPEFQQLINGVAERVEIQVSGVSAETVRLAVEDADIVKGAKAYIGRVTFDDDWQLVGTVTWESEWRCDVIQVGSQDQNGKRTRTISISIGSENTNRSFAPLAFFTDADQRKRSSDDAIFDHVAAIMQGTSRRFGPAAS